uniref:ATP synthase complex subunit 8 n=1 Tax=Tropiocolotes tripolitanus TaxID=930273 RepID=A0A0A1H9T9_9SAUR|nr:ATPase subunit 8 [Tropiocolotes tripolitanus]
MPQLNPTPWFTTLMLTWFTLAVILTLLNTAHPLKPPNQQQKTLTPAYWSWSWQ